MIKMVSVDFEMDQEHTIIQAELDEQFQDVINRYTQKTSYNPSSIYLILNGKPINPQQTVESQMSELNKQNRSMNVLVYLREEENPNKAVKVKAKEIICPKCFEPCRIKTENFKLTLFDCVNNHKTEDILIKDFPETQKINISNIICDKCKIKNKGESYNYEFYKCLTCKNNLCLLCKRQHDANHIIINDDDKNYLCLIHNHNFIKYCTQCKKNICDLCIEKHGGHNTIDFDGLKTNVEEAKKQLNEIKKEIEIFVNKINGIINQLSDLIEYINIYYEFNNNILKNSELQKINYPILQNMKDLNINNEIIENLNKINHINNIKDQLLNIFDLYKNINENLKAPPIGIDLGTSNNCVAVYQNDEVKIIPDDNGERFSSSYIAFTDTKKLFGETAKKNRNPLNTLFCIKRLIGHNFDSNYIKNWKQYWPFNLVKDPESQRLKLQISYQGQIRSFFVEEILAMELLKIKLTASKYLGKEVKEAVISVPNCLFSSKRQMIKDAAKIAGLNVSFLLGETHLASLEYEMKRDNRRWGQTIFVFDLGGGFLNIAIIGLLRGLVEVKSMGGSYNIGGEDFTNRLIDYCAMDFKGKTSLDIKDNPKAFKILRAQCEKAKHLLSSVKETIIDVDGIMDGKDLFIKITRDKFEELCDDLFKKCLKITQELMEESKTAKEKIDEVVLIGGSSRIPKIHSILQDYFNGKQLYKKLNPNESVASGAAILAAKYSKIKNEKIEKINLLGIIPFSLGVEIPGGGIDILIPKNSSYPCKMFKNFSTIYDNQSSILIKLYEGNSHIAQNNCLIAELNFTGLPPGPKGIVSIQVLLEVDYYQNIYLSATDILTKKEVKILVNYEKYRLKQNYIDKLIPEYAKEFELNQRLENINSKIEKIFGDVKNDCKASSDEINSKKMEMTEILEKWYHKKD